MTTLHSIIDKAWAEKESSMDMFCTYLQNDIMELDNDVLKIKLKSQVGVEVEFFILSLCYSRYDHVL